MLKKIWICIFTIFALGVLLSEKVSAQSYLLGMIEVKFCNYQQTNKELDIVSKAGKKLPLCVEFTNKSKQSITINADFLDSVITDDSFKDRACNAADRPKTRFGNFMLPYESKLVLPAGKTVQKQYAIRYPIGFNGLSHGCLAYHIVGGDIKDSEMFTVRIRSIKYIDIFVSDTAAVQTVRLSQSPILTKTDDEYIVSFGVENKGNVEEKIHITSILSNILGYEKEFTFDTTIGANTGIILTTPSFILPVYGGPFRFRNKISYMPQFNFNVTNGVHPSKIYAGGIKTSQTILFVRTRQSRLVMGIIALILYSIFRPRKKVSSVNTGDLKK